MKNKFTKVISLLCVLTLTISIGIVQRVTDDPEPWNAKPEICINL